MKSRLDEVIQEIRPDEVLDMDGKLEPQQRERIENRILTAIFEEQKSPYAKKKDTVQENENTDNVNEKTCKKKKSHRKFLTLMLAAVLVIAFALTAGAASEHDWDVALVNFMGISDADTVQLPDGNIQIGVSDVCYGVDYSKNPAGEQAEIRMIATSSIGDKNAAYIRIDTNYELPEDFDPERDYVLPEDTDISVHRRKNSVTETMRGSTFTTIEEDGKLVLLLYISNCRKINKSYVSIAMENLYVYHDLGINDDSQTEEPELIYEGSWSLDWKYSYRANVETKRMLRLVELDGVKCYLTHMEVSPLGIRFEGFVNPLRRVSGAVWLDVDAITFKDGRVLTVGGSSQAGCKDGIWLDGYCGIDVLGEALEVDEIESVTIGGCEISL